MTDLRTATHKLRNQFHSADLPQRTRSVFKAAGCRRIAACKMRMGMPGTEVDSISMDCVGMRRLPC